MRPFVDVGEGCRCGASNVRPPNTDCCEQRRRGCVGTEGREVESRVSAQVGVTVWDWRHQRFPQEIFWEKLTKLTFTNITSTGKIV